MFYSYNALVIILTLILASRQEKASMVKKKVKTAYVQLGSNVHLTCPFKGATATDLNWFKNGQNIKELKVSKFTTYRHRLTIHSSDVKDDGNYTCRNDKQDSYIMRVSVVIAPKVYVRQQSRDVRAGQPHIVECVAYGKPTPTFSWFDNKDKLLTMMNTDKTKDRVYLEVGQTTTNYTTNSYLVNSRTEPEDIGRYTCFVQNTAGSGRDSLTVNVHFKPRLDPSNKNVTISWWAGRNFSLSCDIQGNPAPSIRWRGKIKQMKSEPLYNKSDNVSTIMFFPSVKTSNGSRLLRCVGSNKYGTIRQHFFLQRVYPPARPVIELEEIRNHEAVISVWVPSKTQTPPVRHVVITYKENRSLGDVYTEFTDLVEGNKTRVLLPGVQSVKDYVVTVDAVNEAGRSTAQISIEKYSTDAIQSTIQDEIIVTSMSYKTNFSHNLINKYNYSLNFSMNNTFDEYVHFFNNFSVNFTETYTTENIGKVIFNRSCHTSLSKFCFAVEVFVVVLWFLNFIGLK